MSPEERSEALTKTTLFAKAHETAAAQGQSTVPSAFDDVDLHFVAFVEASSADVAAGTAAQKRIVELDGRRPGPIDHGPAKDFLSVSGAISVLLSAFMRLNNDLSVKDVAEIVRTKFIPHSTSQNFGLISLGPSQ